MAQTSPSPICRTRHAVILAAGESKRTRPLTLQRPKPLISLLGQPLLAHILDQLVGLVERVTLVVGYRADDIRAHFGAAYRGMQLFYVHQQQVNGTAGALMVVADALDATGEPHLDEPFFLLYGDNMVSQIDLLKVCQQRYSMAALPVDDPSGFGILDVTGNRVLRIIEKPTDAPPGSLSNPGIFHFDSQVFPALRQIQPSSRGEYELTDLIGVLAQQHTISYHVCEGYWVPVGNPWEALTAGLFLLQQRAALRSNIHEEANISPDCVIEGSVHIGRAFIGAGTRIVGPAWIGDGVFIGSDCTISHSVLEAGASLDDGCTIEYTMLGQHVQIGYDCRIQHSLLDNGASVSPTTTLLAHDFEEFTPVAYTAGLLDQTTMRRRGVVLGSGVALPDEATPQPGLITFPEP
jgi:bifunctional UDP-N-acetylglucosamine pyrophosphorylase/glucosamine-1-phosphate N-acetyltransferase